jgi:Domain of Unknown Function (DUF1080).
MQKLFVALVPVVLLACHSSSKTSGQAVSNTLSAAEKKQGFTLLFDGTSKNGWHIYNNKSDGSAWKVDSGTIYLDKAAKQAGAGGGDLTTDDEFENFHLKLDWKIDSAGNSGIIFLSHEDPKFPASYQTGPEMQIIDNAGHRDARIDKHRGGDLYDLIAAVPQNTNPWGQWNSVELIINKGKLEYYQNGVKVVTTTLWDDNWKEMVSKSKFKNWPDFAKFNKGHIVLQDHGDRVWFRNIRIRKL